MALLKNALTKLVNAHKKTEVKLPEGLERMKKVQEAAKKVSQEVKSEKG